MSLNPLLIQKHEKYFKICLQSFPSKAQSEDSNKLALIYFCLHGLGLLNKLNLPDEERNSYSEYIYEHLIIDPIGEIQSFRPSQTFKLPASEKCYDLPNLSATFFALANLLTLKSDYSKRIDRIRIMKFVQKLQITDGLNKGSFKSVLDKDGNPFGETDLRFCYIALCIRKLLKYEEIPVEKRLHDIDVKSLTTFVLDKVNFNGGLSSHKLTESHSGLTYCGVACLGLLDYDFQDCEWSELTKDWLIHRQVDYPPMLFKEEYDYYELEDVGGFNGRENKFSDTCYSWWVTGSLSIIDEKSLKWANLSKAAKYLLNKTQNPLMGGFGKSPDAFPDPFHSFLALASLSLWKSNSCLKYENENELNKIDNLLVITYDSKVFLDEHIYKC